MKKRNFITGFSAAFAALVTLASCGGIRAKDGVVLTINGKEYTAEQLFGDQKTPAAAEAKFNAVYKVAVRKYFEDKPGKDYMDEITRDTKNKISGSKAEAQSNANKNGTSYDTEWKKILSTNGVEDEDELYDKFEYDLEKTKFEDVFYANNYDTLREGGYFHEKDGDKTAATGDKLEKGYLESKQPYHMKHILVKISAKDKDNTTGEITATEAENLYKVITSLASGSSFDQVSELYNEDATAKKAHGSLGIMSRDTSFVNDFKLGTYMYEAFFGSSTQDGASKLYKNKSAKTALGLDDTNPGTAGDYANKINEFNDPTTSDFNQAEEVTSSKGIGQIPFGEVLKLASQKEGGLGDVDFSDPTGKTQKNFEDAGIKSSDVKAKYFPRNVIFNKYFNKHNVMVITPMKAPTLTASDYIVSGGKKRGTKKDIQRGDFDPNMLTEYPGFNLSKKNNDEIIGKLPQETQQGENRNVLRDNNGRVIFVFRSGSGSNSSNDSGYQGIHFVVIERSPFISSEVDEPGKETSLEEYYTEYYPAQENTKHPTYTAGGKDYKHTFTNYIMNDPDVLNQKTRADTVKSELKKANDNLNTYIYNYLKAKGDLKFSATAEGKKIAESIDDWIRLTKRQATEEETTKKWNETWETYYYSLQAQAEQRKEEVVGSSVVSRLVPEICVDGFQNKLGTGYEVKDLFGVGGIFHD